LVFCFTAATFYTFLTFKLAQKTTVIKQLRILFLFLVLSQEAVAGDSAAKKKK